MALETALGLGVGIGAGLLGQDLPNGAAPGTYGLPTGDEGGFWGPSPTPAPPPVTPGTIDPRNFNPFFGPAPEAVQPAPVPQSRWDDEDDEAAHDQNCDAWWDRQKSECRRVYAFAQRTHAEKQKAFGQCIRRANDLYAQCMGGDRISLTDADIISWERFFDQ